MSKVLEIYYDQDGVLNLFAEKIIDIYNEEKNDNYDWRLNKSYYWENSDIKAEPGYINEVIDRPNVFGSCKVECDAQKYMQQLINDGFEVGIITLPRWNAHCPGEKVNWIKEHFPFFDIRNIHMTAKKEKFANVYSILLDDNVENLQRWQLAGGISIAYAQGWNENWEGYRISNHQDFYTLVNILEDAFSGKGITVDALKRFYYTPVEMAEGGSYGETLL